MEIPPPGMELDFYKVNMFSFTVQMFCHCFETNGFALISLRLVPTLPFPFHWDDRRRQLNGWIEEYLIYLSNMAVRLLGTKMKTFLLCNLINSPSWSGVEIIIKVFIVFIPLILRK